MKININPTINYRYQNFSIKNSTKPQTAESNVELPNYKNFSNITFQAKTVKFKKPIFENPETQKLSDKISYFLEKLPQNFNIKKPIEIKTGRDVIGFTIDRTEENKTKIFIKRKEHAEKIENWETNEEFSEILNIVLNNNGQMVEGSYMEPAIYNGYGSLFERNERNVRRLKMGGMTFVPTAGDNSTWKAINKDERFIIGNSIPFSPEDYKLQNFFYELTKLDTAL